MKRCQSARLTSAAASFVLALSIAVVGAAPASAATETWDTPVLGGYSWVVPAGITSATFNLAGASGGAAGGSRGGTGGRTIATIPVTPGETLQINVGGAGGRPIPINGGGYPGNGYCSLVNTTSTGCLGGSGGDASDVRQGGTALDDRVLVAGGGGGAGGPGQDPSADCPSGCGTWGGGDGGDAGGLGASSGAAGVGRPFDPPPGSWLGGCGGVGGGQAPSDPPASSGCYGNRGYSRAGAGGTGSRNTAGGGTGSGTGGGGGSGYFGGSGGGSGQGGSGGGGGGGGSSFATPAATGVSIVGAVNQGDGKVTVTYGGAPVAHTLSVARSGAGTGGVTSSPGGINCGATCSGAYDEGTLVTLTATPTGGSTFAGFTGGGCGATSPCTVTMNADKSVSARFDPPTPPPRREP